MRDMDLVKKMLEMDMKIVEEAHKRVMSVMDEYGLGSEEYRRALDGYTYTKHELGLDPRAGGIYEDLIWEKAE